MKQWRNRVISDGYEPGSTFKVLTMSAALDCGAIDLNTPSTAPVLSRFRDVPSGSTAGAPRDTGRKKRLRRCKFLQHRLRHIALKLGGERFYEYVKNFGVLEKTGIDLAGESKGVFFDKALVTDTDKWGTASLTSGSFGQTFKITPLQLVRAISSVVNGGQLMEPYDRLGDSGRDGSTVMKAERRWCAEPFRGDSDTMRTSLSPSLRRERQKMPKLPVFPSAERPEPVKN